MLDKVVDGRISYHQTMVYKGKTYTNVTSSTYAYFRYESDKISVDTGRFQPGEYRVNPYAIADGVYELGECEFAHSETHPDGRIFTYEISGASVVFPSFSKAQVTYLTFNSDPYRQLALQKAQAKVGKGEVQLGEDLGEIRETIQLLREPMSALKKFFVDDNSRNMKLLRALELGDIATVTKLGKRTASKGADAFASTWLEFWYGVRPLISTLENVIETVDGTYRKILDPKKIYTVRTKLDFTEFDTQVKLFTVGTLPITSTTTVRDDVQATASVAFRYNGPPPGTFDQLGLTARFLPETAWALTRASFVADWIFSIGPWLESLRINPGYEILGHTTGIKHTRTCTLAQLQSNLAVDGFDHYKQHAVPNSFLKLSKYEREVNTSAVYLPHFTWGRTLDLFKAIDSISLIWQSLPQRKRN